MTAREKFNEAARRQKERLAEEKKAAKREAARVRMQSIREARRQRAIASYQPPKKPNLPAGEILIKDAAELVGKSVFTLRNRFADGRIKGRREGSFVVLELESLLAYVAWAKEARSACGRRAAMARKRKLKERTDA